MSEEYNEQLKVQAEKMHAFAWVYALIAVTILAIIVFVGIIYGVYAATWVLGGVCLLAIIVMAQWLNDWNQERAMRFMVEMERARSEGAQGEFSSVMMTQLARTIGESLRQDVKTVANRHQLEDKQRIAQKSFEFDDDDDDIVDSFSIREVQ